MTARSFGPTLVRRFHLLLRGPSLSRFLLFFSILCASIAVRAQSPKLAADFSIAIAQDLLSAPPLPTLDRSRSVLTPQAGTVRAWVDSEKTVSGETTFDNGVKGYSYGLGLALPLTDDLSFYLFGMGSDAKGKTNAWSNGSIAYAVSEIKTTSYIGASGFSYRLLGSDDTLFALGLFAGGTYFKVSSDSVLTSSGVSARYAFDPSYYGAYQGLQLMIRLGPFRINPYGLYFANLEKSCQTILMNDAPAQASSCEGQAGKVETHTTFKGYGVNLGIKSLLFTAYSQALHTNESIHVKKFSVTWGFVF